MDAGVANEVPRLVFSSVMSDHAKLVDFVAVNKYGRDTFFVVKPHLRQSKEDIKALRRLGPRINLTIHDTQELKGHSMEVKVHLDNTDVLVRYGVSDPVAEKSRLLKHAVKLMSRQLWIREKDRLVTNRKNRGVVEPLSRDWTKPEKDQLLTKGYVERYQVGLKVDLEKFPELAYDIHVYQFVKN